MTREEIIEFLKTKKLSPTLVTEIVEDYFKSLNKTDSEISEILKAVHSNPQIMTQIIMQAIPYLELKFEICSVIDPKTGRVLLYY